MQKKNNKMTSTENLLKTILNVNSVVIDGIRLQADPPGGMSIHLDVRPRIRSKRRCPVCGWAYLCYDRESTPEHLF